MANDSHKHDNGQGNGHGGGHGHYILPDSKAWKTFGALIALTIITVALSYVHLGAANYVVGMIVATIKAFLVASIFMGLKHDDRANSFIFISAFIFLAIFIGLTVPDVFFRGDVYVNGKPLTMPVKGGPSKFKRPWEATPEVLAHGKELFATNCASCHGAEGHGDGPASAALNPKPRNFTQDAGWKNGRKITGIFKTLREGIPGSGMPSFASIPAEDRWTLSNYVSSLGPNGIQAANAADFTSVGVDPTKDAGGSDEAPSIPVDQAISTLVKEEREAGQGNVKPGNEALEGYGRRLDARTFAPSP
jgi:caa(3)-type oxidase subunit IV